MAYSRIRTLFGSLVFTSLVAVCAATAPTAMALDGAMAVDCSAVSAQIQVSCTYSSGATFSVQVHITAPPQGPPEGSPGYNVFQARLTWPSLKLDYLEDADPANEVVGPDAAWRASHCSNVDRAIEAEAVRSTCTPNPTPDPLFTDPASQPVPDYPVLKYQFHCISDGVAALNLPAGTGLYTQFTDAASNAIVPSTTPATVQCGLAAPPGVTITQSGGSTDVVEDAVGDTYDVKLTSQPTSDVTVSVNPDSQVTRSPTSLTFTPSNFHVNQAVTVGAIDDAVDEASSHTGAISHAATSADSNYNGISIANVTANIADNDTAGVTITQSGDSTDVAEGAAGDTYDVKLDSQPISDVTVNVNPDSQVTRNPASMTFTSANWNLDQSVSVGAVDDAVDEASPHPGTISHAAISADSNYNGISIANVTPSIADNDSPPPPDSDGDGVPDSADACPAQPAGTPDGCPSLPAVTPQGTTPDLPSPPAPPTPTPLVAKARNACAAKKGAALKTCRALQKCKKLKGKKRAKCIKKARKRRK